MAPPATPDPLPLADLRAGQVLARAIDAFDGDWQMAALWFHTPHPALCNQAPWQLALTAEGVAELETILLRAVHGIHG